MLSDKTFVSVIKTCTGSQRKMYFLQKDTVNVKKNTR